MRKFRDITNQRFGNLLVLERVESQRNKAAWKCLCDCGKELVIIGQSLYQGATKSCGCLKRSVDRLRPFEALYRTISRTSNKRGVKVDLSYEEFLSFTKQPKCHYCGVDLDWIPYTTNGGKMAYNLDRKNNALSYSKENCVVCCRRCNWGKQGHFTYEEWLQIGALIESWKFSK
jgi:hypothetical protein